MHGEVVHSLPKSLPEIPALTGLRFFAAFFILFAHAVDWLAQFQDSEAGTPFTLVALYGMPLFFVLSGFVIHYNYGKQFGTKPFARAMAEFGAARFARLFPLYFCFLLMAIIADEFVMETFNRPELAAKILAYYATLTQTWDYHVYDGRNIVSWLFPLSWSISTEVFFYLAYVPTVYVVLRIKGARSAFVTAVLFAAAITLLLLCSLYELTPILDFAGAHVRKYVGYADFQHSYYRWLFYFSPYARVFEFLMGCLTAHLFIATRERPAAAWERHAAAMALVVALGLLVLVGMLYQDWIKMGEVNNYIRHLALNFLCAPAIAVVMFCACRYDNAFSRFLSLPLLVALGDTSYSIYIVHTWTLRMLNHPLMPFNWIWGIEAIFRVAFAIILTLIVAYATYRLIEVPSRIYLRRVFSRWIAAIFRDGVAPTRAPGVLGPEPQPAVNFSKSS
jgi:peptidoglycan/LPS O-acetylase OafA/YrhL